MSQEQRGLTRRSAMAAGLLLSLISMSRGFASTLQFASMGQATGVGPDDFNTATLDPCCAKFIFTKKFLDAAKIGTPFASWDFNMVDESDLISPGDLKVTLYQPWVVHDPAVTEPGGRVVSRGFEFDDVGGVDFVMQYNPHGSGEPKASDIHFLQIIRSTSNGGAPFMEIDNNGASDTPFYDGHFDSHIANSTVKGDISWMVDIPFVCEGKAPGVAGQKCGPPDEARQQYTMVFDTFVVQTSVSDPHDVLVYGGREWGFTYTATDTPEPATSLLAVTGILGLFGMRWGFQRGRSGFRDTR